MLAEIERYLDVPIEELERYDEIIPKLTERLSESLDHVTNHVGEDVDAATLRKLSRMHGDAAPVDPLSDEFFEPPTPYFAAIEAGCLAQGGSTWRRLARLRRVAAAKAAFEEAQLGELAFWRHVAFSGYLGTDPRCLPLWQRQTMLGSYQRTGWPVDRFQDGSVVEIGCGPLGMIEFVPAKQRAAFDPLNPHYDRLFSKIRSPEIEYVADLAALVARSAGRFDLGICYNVLDHTVGPRALFDDYFALIRPGGHFLLEVNLADETKPRTEEHKRMHPSPFSEEKIRGWLDDYSDGYETYRADQPSTDNEFFFMAWGRKRAN